MSGYSTINAMGLVDLDSISHHVLSSKDNQDVLKVYFKTPEDSTLPDSCCFYFEQSKAGESDDPTLLAAIDELTLLTNQQSNSELQQRLLNDLERLELVMASKLQELRADLSQFN